MDVNQPQSFPDWSFAHFSCLKLETVSVTFPLYSHGARSLAFLPENNGRNFWITFSWCTKPTKQEIALFEDIIWRPTSIWCRSCSSETRKLSCDNSCSIAAIMKPYSEPRVHSSRVRSGMYVFLLYFSIWQVYVQVTFRCTHYSWY